MALTATIDRDDYGVAHVTASSEKAAFFAVGYAQCEDRFEQLLRNYLLVRGELAAALGPAALGADLRVRRWLIAEEARRGYDLLSSEVQAIHAAFLAGVRQYMSDHPEQVPDWAPPLEPWQPLAMTRGLFFWAYAFNDGLAALMRSGVNPDDDVTALLEGSASNGWVVMPSRTADGSLILLSDPHGELAGTIEPWEFTVEAGYLHSFGQTIVGTPLPLWGHTAHTAWAMTTGGPSVSDCYAVVTDPEDPLRYQVDGEWQTMEQRFAELRVAGEERPRRAVFDYTHHNGVLCPVVARKEGVAYAIATPYMHEPVLLEEQLNRWHRSRTVDDLLVALRGGGMFTQNVILGDSGGNCAYVRAGRVPIRAAGVDWRLPVDGNTASTAWLGIHPLEDLVQLRDPEAGFLQNCNVSPDTMLPATNGTALDHSGYPDYIVNDDAGRTHTRGRRAIELLAASTHATVDDALRSALDDKWLDVEHWQAAVASARDTGPWDEVSNGFCEGIAAFDGHAASSSVGALRYYYFRRALGLTSAEEPDAVRDVSVAVEAGQSLSAEQLGRLRDALTAGAAEMLERHGTTDVPLGDVFRVGRGANKFPGGGPFFMTRQPTPADANVHALLLAPLRLAEYRDLDENNQRLAWFGSRSLLLTILRPDGTSSFACAGFGQSHDPESAHHADQARLFSEGRLRPTYFDSASRTSEPSRRTELRVPD